MKRRILIYITLFVNIHVVHADFDKNAFLKRFNNLDYKEKVKLLANTDFNDIKDIYPQIKDTLEKIRKYVYTQTSSNEAKFLFDIIEANLCIHQNQFSKCINIGINALQYHCDNINDSLRALLLLKECYLKINDFNKALEVHKIIEKNWNRKTVALWMGVPKSTIYGYLGIYKYAIAERKREYEAGSHDNWEAARMYNDIGVFYNRMRKYDSAEVYFNKALKELGKGNKRNIDTNYYKFFISLIKSNLAVGYLKNKRYKEAIPYLLIDVRNSLANKEYESAFNAYIGLIEAYLGLKRYDVAKKYLDTLDNIDIPEARNPKNLAQKYYWKSVYYEKTGELNKSLDYLKQYINFNDSVRQQEKELQVINAEIAYNVQEKDNAIREKNMALAILKVQQEKSDTVKTYLIVFIVILLIAGFILFRYYREVQKYSKELEIGNQTIRQQNKTIRKALKEKEMLVKEIHHRVKNNLQIINSIIGLQISKENDENRIVLLNEISSRIQSIALTHQMLYKKDKFLEINVAEYLTQLCQQIISAFSDESNITLNTFFEKKDIEISLDKAIPLGLICSEVITNAIKYAFPDKKGTIDVHFNCDNNNCILIIKDDGIGMDIKKYEKTESLGIELIKLLTEQLEAKHTFKVENGTAFELQFKCN